MGNFEKLGVLVVIVLAVVILVLTFWGMSAPQSKVYAEDSGTNALSNTGPTGSKTSGNKPSESWPKPEHGHGSHVLHPAHPHPAPNPPPAPKPTIYTIKPGDTLSKIAALRYGSSRYWKAIMKANPSIDPGALRVGSKISLPDPSTVVPGGSSKSGGEEPVADKGSGKTYTVKKDDTLWNIAKHELGPGARYRSKIVEANPKVFHGDNHAVLAVGTVLKIPTR